MVYKDFLIIIIIKNSGWDRSKNKIKAYKKLYIWKQLIVFFQ